MTLRTCLAIFLISILCVFLVSQASFAQNNSRYNGDNYYGSQKRITFDSDDRAMIQDYYEDYYAQICSRNFSRNRSECAPPARNKKYRIGRNLPNDIKVYYLPQNLEKKLSRLPQGYEYVRWDKDVLLIASRTGRVMDAVEYAGDDDRDSSRLYPIQNSYVVYFDPQTATLARGESRILDQVAREVRATRPRQVTVTSYADSFNDANFRNLNRQDTDALFLLLEAFGMAPPNQNDANLARGLRNVAAEQEETISNALTKRGVNHQILDSRDRGPLEDDLVSQNDWGIEETQMVVIDLRD